MTGQFHRHLLAVASYVGGVLLAIAPRPAAAAPTPAKPVPLPPPVPAVTPVRSPVDYFRDLLKATPAERVKLLADKSPAQREVYLKSLREYEALPWKDREVRLLALEVRLHLSALIRLAPTNRAARLAVVPGPVLPLVSERLQRWDQSTAVQRKDLLENERAVRAILSLDATRPSGGSKLASYPTQQLTQLEKDIARWKELSADQQQRILSHFQDIFSLADPKKDGAFERLNAAEKQQMEKTLATFKQLSKTQRDLCVTNFTRFARMSREERRQFLQSAERWSEMQPEDRKAWSVLVSKVPPMPPSPPGLFEPPPPPPLPSTPPRAKGSLVVTNQ